MRVDETRIPSGGRIKVRCPHCQGVGFAEHDSEDSSADKERISEPAAERNPLQPGASSASEFPPEETSAGFDLRIPEDSFRAFRFPAEEDADRPARRRTGTGMKILLWAGISLAVIAIFALLVNIILPGPHGGKLF